jgi:hypothetical protein
MKKNLKDVETSTKSFTSLERGLGLGEGETKWGKFEVFHFIFSRDGVVKKRKIKGDKDRESNHRNKDRIEQSGNESCGVKAWWQHVIYSNSTSL